MAKKQKKKKSTRMPPLGWPDRLLYAGIILLCAGLALGTLFLRGFLQDVLLPAENLLARTWGIGNYNIFFLFFWFFIAALEIYSAYKRRRPILGQKDVNYGPPQYAPIYPLLPKHQPAHYRCARNLPSAKSLRRTKALFLLVTFLFCATLFPPSIYSRVQLYPDRTFSVHNALNREVRSHSAEDVASVEFSVDRHFRSYRIGGPSYKAKVYFEMTDGSDYWFSLGSFRGDTAQELHTMLELKEEFAPFVTISQEGYRKYRTKVINEYHMTAEEVQLLDQLFDVNP